MTERELLQIVREMQDAVLKKHHTELLQAIEIFEGVQFPPCECEACC